ncbi:hypothetical protein JCM9533A_66640 [Catenuloplanes niger JCM 9533]
MIRGGWFRGSAADSCGLVAAVGGDPRGPVPMVGGGWGKPRFRRSPEAVRGLGDLPARALRPLPGGCPTLGPPSSGRGWEPSHRRSVTLRKSRSHGIDMTYVSVVAFQSKRFD